MFTSSAFNNLVTVQTLNLDASQDAMDTYTTWTDLFTDFCMVSTVARVQQMPQDYNQAWINQGVYKFTFRRDFELTAGSHRIMWNNKHYHPVNLTRHSGINRFEGLTTVYARLAGEDLTR